MINQTFHLFATKTAQYLGAPYAFISALTLVVGWIVAGPFLDFSSTWQMFINTTTTVVTFLMIFLVQSTQNRDTKALHLKLDELIRSSKARNTFADLEDATEEELDHLKGQFQKLRSEGGSKNA